MAQTVPVPQQLARRDVYLLSVAGQRLSMPGPSHLGQVGSRLLVRRDEGRASRGEVELVQVQGGDGRRAGLQELNFTSACTTLITAYEETTADLSKVGGPRHAKVLAGHAQEIDIATGKLLWDWDSLGHVGVEESYEEPTRGNRASYDYFHINSVSEAPDGNVLISAKNTWAVYKVDRSSGRVIWRMNGK